MTWVDIVRLLAAGFIIVVGVFLTWLTGGVG